MSSVLILGANGGIGSALVKTLSAKGRELILSGKNVEKLTELAEEFAHPVYAWDSRDENAWKENLAKISEAGITLDAIVQLAGSIVIKPMGSLTWAEVQETLEKNLQPAFFTVKYGAPLLAENGGGSIILMSSVAAQFGLANHEAISAAKAAIEGLALSAAASYAPRNVRINVIAPALVETPLSKRFVSSDVARKASADMHPLGRIGQANDIAQMIATLVDPEFSWMTGQVLSIDGGMSRVKSKR